MTHSISRRITRRSRLPWWIRRGVRLWARCAHWMGGRAAACGVRRAHAADELAVNELPVPSVEERRCGWFDSSQDLREGLCISEHASGDAVAAELPVMAWVQLQLSGWRPRLEAVRPEPAR